MGHFVIYVNGAKSDTRETAGFLPFPVFKRPNKKQFGKATAVKKTIRQNTLCNASFLSTYIFLLHISSIHFYITYIFLT